jgi:hypothetical protein
MFTATDEMKLGREVALRRAAPHSYERARDRKQRLTARNKG